MTKKHDIIAKETERVYYTLTPTLEKRHTPGTQITKVCNFIPC